MYFNQYYTLSMKNPTSRAPFSTPLDPRGLLSATVPTCPPIARQSASREAPSLPPTSHPSNPTTFCRQDTRNPVSFSTPLTPPSPRHSADVSAYRSSISTKGGTLPPTHLPPLQSHHVLSPRHKKPRFFLDPIDSTFSPPQCRRLRLSVVHQHQGRHPPSHPPPTPPIPPRSVATTQETPFLSRPH